MSRSELFLSLAACLAVMLIGCGPGAVRWDSKSSAETYTVKSGDTLYSIAWRHDLDHRRLAEWNGLGEGGLIYPGQALRLRAPSSRTSIGAAAAKDKRDKPPPPRDPAPGWGWPAEGTVVARFGDPNSVGKGIDIGGRVGQPVRAAAAGEVVYTGSGLIRYGQLIIVKHNNTFLSAYGHNSALFVKEGERVTTGQRIASMGEGPGKRPVLHFEIRLNGEPVDPIQYLPKR